MFDDLPDISLEDIVSAEDMEDAAYRNAKNWIYSREEIDVRLKKLSHSQLDSWRRCPRAAQLNKLATSIREDTIDSVYGKCFGGALEVMFQTDSLERAVAKAFTNWSFPVTEWNPKKKTVWHVMSAVVSFWNLYYPQIKRDYELVTLPNGRPGTEVGFQVMLGNGWRYVGFIDFLMLHKASKMLTVFELKTTSVVEGLEYMYQNSFQAVGYATVVDAIARSIGCDSSSYKVQYFIQRAALGDLEFLSFPKPTERRLQWLQQLMTEVATMELHQGISDVWPLNGSNCRAFGRGCPHFGRCTMKTENLAQPPGKERPEPEYDFTLNVQDLLVGLGV